MRHRKRSVRLGRHGAHFKATLNSLAANLILYNRIETTLTKAKLARRLAERLVTWAKKGSLHHRRLAYSVLKERDLVKILFAQIGPLFANRQGGYTRIYRTRVRSGDAAEMAVLEWTEVKKKETVPKKAVKKEVEKEKPASAPKQQKPQEHVKTEEKPRHHKEEKKPKGFFSGLRKFFNRKSPG